MSKDTGLTHVVSCRHLLTQEVISFRCSSTRPGGQEVLSWHVLLSCEDFRTSTNKIQFAAKFILFSFLKFGALKTYPRAALAHHHSAH